MKPVTKQLYLPMLLKLIGIGAFLVGTLIITGCSKTDTQEKAETPAAETPSTTSEAASTTPPEPPSTSSDLATGINYEEDAANPRTLVFDNTRGARFCELFFIKLKGDMKELHVYNPTGLNNMAETGDSCPDSLINNVDLKGLKEHFKMDGIYYNKPRHWICDKITLPVGAKRKLGEMEWYWMASSHMPAKTEMKPGFLTYKHVPVERKSEIVFRAGNTVFLLDDPEGKVWVMKTYRHAYDQTYDNIKDLPSRYKNLPEGYKFRVVTLEKDLILRPTEGTATVMQDEFENTFDYLGDGSSNYIP